jgi:hypothetical protein
MLLRFGLLFGAGRRATATNHSLDHWGISRACVTLLMSNVVNFVLLGDPQNPRYLSAKGGHAQVLVSQQRGNFSHTGANTVTAALKLFSSLFPTRWLQIPVVP